MKRRSRRIAATEPSSPLLQSPQPTHSGIGGSNKLQQTLRSIGLAATNASYSELRTVDLSWSDLGDAGTVKLADALRTDETVIELILVDNNIGDAGATALAGMLCRSDSKSFSTNRSGIGNDNDNEGNENDGTGNNEDRGAPASKPSAHVRGNSWGNSTLTTLNLSGNHITPSGGKSLLNALVANHTVISLSLMGNDIGDELLKTIECMVECNRVSAGPDEASRRKDAILGRRVRRHMRQGSGQGGSSPASSRTGKFEGGELTSENARSVASEIIKDLSFVATAGRSSGTGEEVEVQLVHDASVGKLTTVSQASSGGGSDCSPSKLSPRSQFWERMAGMESSGRLLSSASYGGLMTEHDESEFERTLRRIVDDDPTLSVLNLNSMKLEDVGAIMLAEALRLNTMVRSISLRGNCIGAEGSQALADALRANFAVKSLDLADNALGDAGAAAMAKLLRHGENTTLGALDLSRNGIGPVGGVALVEALLTNSAIVSLELAGNLSIGPGLMQRVMALVARNSGKQKPKLSSSKSSEQTNDRGRKGSPVLCNKKKKASINRMVESELDRTVRRLREHDTTLTEIDLSWKLIGDGGTARLARAMRDTNNTVRSLNLSGNKIGVRGTRLFADGVLLKRNNSALTEMDLSENRMGDAGARALSRALQENATLTKLVLEQAQIGDVGGRALSELLSVNTTLSTIVLSKNSVGDDTAKALSDTLCTNKTLKMLELTGNRISNDGGEALVDSLLVNGTITVLTLDDNDRINGELCAMVARLLEINKESKSAREAAHRKKEEFGRLGLPAKPARTRERSDLDHVLEKIMNNHESAVDIELSWRHIGDAGAVSIAEALRGNTTVTTVDLSGNDIGVEGAKALASALSVNRTVTKLDLWDNNISAGGGTALADALVENDAITSLDVSNNGIGDGAARAFARALRRNTALRKLVMTNDGIGDEGGTGLAEALLLNRTITSLVLYKNRIGEEGGRALLEALRENNTITKLNLENNRLSDEQTASINDRIQKNKASAAMKNGLKCEVTDSDIEKGRATMQRIVESESELEPEAVPLRYLEDCTENFSDSQRLGEGAYGEVFLGTDKVLRRKFAIKRIRLKVLVDIDIEQAKRTFERELATMKHFHHPNIARLYAYSFSDDLRGSQCLVFELAANGSLDHFLSDSREKEKLHWTTRVNIALDVARALQFLHEGRAGQKCFHRDIKASNVCLKRNHTALLVDCGTAKMLPTDESNLTMTIMETRNGLQWTPGYVCPIFASSMRNYSSASDVYSLGMVYIELLTGTLQHSKVSGEIVDLFNLYGIDGANKLKADADTCAGTWGEEVLNDFSALSLECISLVPKARPTIQNIVERLEKLASLARPWSSGEKNNITVLTSSPLAWMDTQGRHHPFPGALNYEHEKDLLTQCIREAKRSIKLTFDVATDDRLQAAVTKRCGCLHFSGHGYTDCLVLEDGGTGGAHFLDQAQLRKIVSVQPFKFAFVSACHSGLMGHALVTAGVPHVVCCNADSQLRDDAAIKFTYSFYHALAEGYTVKAAYAKGRLAVSNRFDNEEVEKFQLLPEEGDHDQPLFDAEMLTWEDESVVREQFIPPLPEHFLGRELDMFKLLKGILSKRLVTVAGTSGVGCSSLASAICHYIRERQTTVLAIEEIYFIRRGHKTNGDPIDMFIKPLYDQIASIGRVSPIGNWFDPSDLFSSIFQTLAVTKALVVFDGILGGDHAIMKAFIEELLQKTNKVKVLLTARAPMHLLSYNVIEHVFRLEPLDLQSTARLFAEVCTHFDTTSSRREFLDALCSDSAHTDETKLERLGGGNPRRTIESAMQLSKDDFAELMKL